MLKHLLTGKEVERPQFEKLMELARVLKETRGQKNAMKPLEGKSVGLIFAKSSTRTRVSFEVGVHELGGQPLYLDQGKTQMGRGETIPDTARVLSRFLHAIVIRTYAQADVDGLAQYASCPIVNALTDEYHPTQALTDMFTILEKKGKFDGVKMAYFGDGASNMANSLMLASRVAGIDFVIAAPEEYRPDSKIMDMTLGGKGTVSWTTNPLEAIKDADFIYTDVWVSMGFEEEAKQRMKILEPYRVNMDLVSKAKKDAMIMHCLPAHRGEEITDEVVESPNSIVFDEAENRLHMHKAILAWLMGD